MSRCRRRLFAVGASLVILLVSACSGDGSGHGSGQGTGQGTGQGSGAQYDRCELGKALVPTCGVLWGVTPQSADTDSLAGVESLVQHRFDVVYRFHGMLDPVVDGYDRNVVGRGRLLHLSLDTADLLARDGQAPWPAIAAGRYDDLLEEQAHQLAALGAPVFVTLDHEANNPSKSVLGTPEEFRAMWQHVHDTYEAAGADNVVWVWVMMGSEDTLASAGALWPGNDDVDWISWDVYNPAGCHGTELRPEQTVSFEEQMTIFYRWVKTQGSALGIDPEKPMMISEAGSVIVPGNPELAADWYAEIPGVLKRYPQIKALGLWDHTGTTPLCDYVFEESPPVLAAITQIGQDPLLASKTDG